MVHIIVFRIDSNIYASQQAQIFLLNIEKVIIFSKYISYNDLFLFDFALELPEYININNDFVNLMDNK